MRFDKHKYESGGWRGALSVDLYERLGLSPKAPLSEQTVREAYLPRYQWWEHKQRLRSTGSFPPIVSEVGPHIDVAIKGLLEAKKTLGNPDARAAYDAHRQTEEQEDARKRVRPFLKALLEVAVNNGRLTPEARRKIVQQGITQGFMSALVEQVLTEEIRTRHIVVGDPEPPRAPTPARDHYEILGLPPTASHAEIETVYRHKHQEYIRARDKDRAKAQFDAVASAYEVLRDPVKRREYDRTRSGGAAGSPAGPRPAPPSEPKPVPSPEPKTAPTHETKPDLKPKDEPVPKDESKPESERASFPWGWVLAVALVVTIAIAAGNSRKDNSNRTTSTSIGSTSTGQAADTSSVIGVWEGQMDSDPSVVGIYKDGGTVKGIMIHEGVREEFSVSIGKTSNDVTLTGTSYTSLKGGSNYLLDTLVGKVNTNRTTLAGQWRDSKRSGSFDFSLQGNFNPGPVGNLSADDARALLGVWEGRFGNNSGVTVMLMRVNSEVAGMMLNNGFVQRLSWSGTPKSFTLTGTKWSSMWATGNYSLDTLTGSLSADQRTLSGSFRDKAGETGSFSFSKTGGGS